MQLFIDSTEATVDYLVELAKNHGWWVAPCALVASFACGYIFS